MKVNYSMFGNASGSLGGTTASHNTYGPYLRKRVRPVNPNTPGQQAVRLAFSNTSQAWGTLTVDEQKAWVTGGPLNVRPNRIGGSQALTGQALYMRVNAFRQQLGLAIVRVPPTISTVPNITQPVIDLSLDGLVTVTFDGGDEWNQAAGGIIVSVSALQPNGRAFINSYGSLGNTQGPAGAPTYQMPYNITAGGLIRYRFAAVTPDGRLSDAVFVDVQTPTQAIVQSAVTTSPTATLFTFSRSVDIADYQSTDFNVAGVAAASLSSGASDREIVATGTGYGAGDTWVLNATAAAGAYTPVQNGTTT